jgi:hypothetical protein
MPATKEQTDEHPIIFSGWSIRRILAGEKTQTRRIAKPQPPDDANVEINERYENPQYADNWSKRYYIDPKYEADDVLWMRESFRLPECYDHLSPREYVDDTCLHAVQYEAYQPYDKQYGGYRWGRKRPSIFLPRELCRLRLRVEDVRVERLQEISHGAAEAEGVQVCNPQETPRDLFRMKWNDIHGTGAWEENPFVWCVEFSTIDSE